MRGLGTTTGGTGHTDTGDRGTDTGPGNPYGGTFQAAFTAVVVVVALALFASACATGGTGTRDEGPARADMAGGSTVSPSAVSSPSATPTPSAVPDRKEAAHLVKTDPSVSAQVKRELTPCVSDDYPIDVSYGDLTGAPAEDIVVNVLSCGDGVGVASYVYREQDGSYRNVFSSEEPPVYAEIDRGYLVVTKQVYAQDDALSNPSSEDVISYQWVSDRFVLRDDTRTDYGDLGDGGTASPDN
ncbi:hypothetical protein [Streptomyces sp. UG1]|uniref:hypothetical protein n=1 Tax=Streptomyces sp. UG1 TaxID=3417652 RepID=UPI003CEFCE00